MPCLVAETTGKYIKDGAETKSSEETLDEEKQKKLWEMSGGYCHMEGYDPIEVPPPPKEEEKKVGSACLGIYKDACFRVDRLESGWGVT